MLLVPPSVLFGFALTAVYVAAEPINIRAAAATTAFVAPAANPSSTSSVYVGTTNTTLKKPTIVPGKAFDRFIQIWLENTDFATAAANPTFQALASHAVLLNRFYALTHPSEANYVGAVGGDTFGMGDDLYWHIASNMSTIVDLLELKNISWASYSENMPTDGYPGYNYTQPNYLNTSAPPYTYYVRKNNPLVIYDSVTSVPSRKALIRNFNDFAADLNASAIPQWVFITPNLVNDAHDTSVAYTASWFQFWLAPLLQDTRFNDGRTLILLTFDENLTKTQNNQVWAILLGGAVSPSLYGTVDNTYYTHYSALSTAQNNFGLMSLGRYDTNKTMANVFSLVANATGYMNVNVPNASIPLTNYTGMTPGPLNPQRYVPYTAPNTSAVGAGAGGVFTAAGLNVAFTAANAPPPVNLTAQGKMPPSYGVPNTTTTPTTTTSSATDYKGGYAGVRTMVLGVLAGGVVLLL